jgi:hypothetical protein
MVIAMQYRTSKSYDDPIEELTTRGRIIGLEYQQLTYALHRNGIDEKSIDGTVIRIENGNGTDEAIFPGEFTSSFAGAIIGCNAEYKAVHRTYFPGSRGCFDSHRFKLIIEDGHFREFVIEDTIYL